jgi:histidine triad (HIT) family protein
LRAPSSNWGNASREPKQLYSVRRAGFLFTGGDIPHVHAHVVPLIASDDITSRRYIREEHVTYQDAPPPARRVADNRR